MTEEEKILSQRLENCSFQAGAWDKSFVKQLKNWKEKEMTEKGRNLLILLFHKYKRQIPDYNNLCSQFEILKTTINKK